MVNIAVGAVANLVTIGSASGAAALDLLCGTGDFTLEGATASTYEISSTGVNTGTCKFASGTGARTVEIAGGGTGVKTINLGTAATADVITIGTSTGAGSLDLACGTGNFTLEGATGSTYEISSTGVNTGTCKFASGTGARTIEIGGGGTGAKTINIAAAASADVVSIGDATGAGSLDLACGTGNFTLEGNVATTYDISATGANTGTCTFAGGTGARTVNVNTGAAVKTTVIGSTNSTSVTTLNVGSGGLIHVGKSIYTPDAITSASAGVAASLETVVTEITTNGDSDLDNVTLANGTEGQIKIFAVVAVGNVSDSIKITPANMVGGTQITFSANPVGQGCSMYYDSGATGWICFGNQGGTVA